MKGVTGKQNQVLDIVPGQLLQLELFEDIPLNYRILCEKQLTPCELNFSYQSVGQISVHASCNRQPQICKRGRPHVVKVFDKKDSHLSEFHSPFIYLRIESETGCNIEFNINFGRSMIQHTDHNRPKKLTTKFNLPDMQLRIKDLVLINKKNNMEIVRKNAKIDESMSKGRKRKAKLSELEKVRPMLAEIKREQLQNENRDAKIMANDRWNEFRRQRDTHITKYLAVKQDLKRRQQFLRM